jgi:thioredoxin reductase
MELHDVIIVGGGPAGLNAAVVLGRCRRKVLLFDTEQYRNSYSHGMHNFLTRDDILPTDFLKICQGEIKKYGVERIIKRIVKAHKNTDDVFVAKDEDGKEYYAKKLLIATGLKDNIPEVPGFKEMYGKSVHHCPYCDGWEVRDKKLGVYAKEKEGWELALMLKSWSPHVTLYTDGKGKIKPFQREHLEANDIPIVKLPFERLQGTDGLLEKIIFKNGEEQACDAIFFVNGYTQQCNLAETFNCEIGRKGVVITNRFQQTSIPGLFVAGDADKDMHLVVVAASEGAKAGVIINKELQKEISAKNLQAVKGKAAVVPESF